MILTKKRILFVTVIVILWVLIMLWGIQRYREDTLTQKQVSTRSLQTQEQVTREYIPERLKEKGSKELRWIGENLWGE
jgi:hypothetical protein